MTRPAFDPRPLLGPLSEALTLLLMAGLTAASAAAYAAAPRAPEPGAGASSRVAVLKSHSAVVRLPTVIVTGRRA